MSVQSGIIGSVFISSVLARGRLNRCFDTLVILSMRRVNVDRVSVGRVQVIDLLNGLNRLVFLSRALFGSSLFGGGFLNSGFFHGRLFSYRLFSRLFALCNNLGESVRRRTLRQLLSRLHGDGNHRLLRMHRNMTGRHLRHNRLLRCHR